MKLFKHNTFYVVASDDSFVTFGTFGYKKCDTMVETSKFEALHNAKNAAKNVENATVYMVQLVSSSANSGGQLSATICWEPVDN